MRKNVLDGSFRKVKYRIKKEFIGQPRFNIIGIGPKIRDGKDTEELSISVFVTKRSR